MSLVQWLLNIDKKVYLILSQSIQYHRTYIGGWVKTIHKNRLFILYNQNVGYYSIIINMSFVTLSLTDYM